MVCGFCYEGLFWFIGVVVMSVFVLDWCIVLIVLFYSIGVYGIMIFNDFKFVEGDKWMGIVLLLVLFGVGNVVRFVCLVMVVF